METKLRILVIDTIAFGFIGYDLKSVDVFMNSTEFWIIATWLVIIKLNNYFNGSKK